MDKRFPIASSLLAVSLTVGGVTGDAGGQTMASTRPVVALTAEAAKYEAMSIGASSERPAGSTTATSMPSLMSAPHSIGFDFGRMAIALSIVLALIFGARWLFTHFFAGARAPATSRAVKVLGRTSLAPRQQVLLLQVGRRVVVVGESNGQLSTLAQLDDPDEVASLIGQLQEEQIARAESFGGFFGRAQRKLDNDEHAPPELPASTSQSTNSSTEPVDELQVKSELSGLMEKVRSIRNQLGQ